MNVKLETALSEADTRINTKLEENLNKLKKEV